MKWLLYCVFYLFIFLFGAFFFLGKKHSRAGSSRIFLYIFSKQGLVLFTIYKQIRVLKDLNTDSFPHSYCLHTYNPFLPLILCFSFPFLFIPTIMSSFFFVSFFHYIFSSNMFEWQHGPKRVMRRPADTELPFSSIPSGEHMRNARQRDRWREREARKRGGGGGEGGEGGVLSPCQCLRFNNITKAKPLCKIYYLCDI